MRQMTFSWWWQWTGDSREPTSPPPLPRSHSIHSHHLCVAHGLELLSPVYLSSSAVQTGHGSLPVGAEEEDGVQLQALVHRWGRGLGWA